MIDTYNDDNKDNHSNLNIYLEISNIIFDIKEKITDNEYKQIMETLNNNNYNKIDEHNIIFKLINSIDGKIINSEYDNLLSTVKKIKL